MHIRHSAKMHLQMCRNALIVVCMDINIDNPARQIAITLEQQAIAAGVSINDVCEKAEVSRSTFTRWKGKTNGANFSTIKRMQDALEELKLNSKTHKKPKS